MEDFLEGFDWPRFRVSNTPDREETRLAKRLLRSLGQTLVSLRLVDGYEHRRQVFTVETGSFRLRGPEITLSHGLLDKYMYVGKGYFQSAQLAADASFRLKPKHRKPASDFLARLPEGPKAFIHVRRGDYRHWRIFDRSPLLHLDYFRQGKRKIESTAPGTQFIVLSDEPEAVTDMLSEPDTHLFTGQNVYEDFGLMTLCDGGVVSNSTLSWWGGFFSNRSLPVIAPQGWLGFTVGIEYPVGIVAPWMTPIEAHAQP
ncbi:hypothetical protein FHS78_002342 [Parvibaculum indicum]|nr:hypothetical protein [Parvibaculum indicum]